MATNTPGSGKKDVLEIECRTWHRDMGSDKNIGP